MNQQPPASAPPQAPPSVHPLTLRLLVGAVILLALGWATYRVILSAWGHSLQRNAQSALDRRDFRTASRYLNQYLAIWPRDANSLLLAARTARRDKNYAEAQRLLRHCAQVRIWPEEFDFEADLLRVQQGHLVDAEQRLRNCAERPDPPEALLVLEAVLEGCFTLDHEVFANQALVEGSEASRLLRAIRDGIDLWFRISPGEASRAQGLVWRAHAHIFGSDHDKGLADFRAALEIDPMHFGARLGLASGVLLTRPQEAATHLQELLRLHPDRQEPRFMLALAFRALRKQAEAQELLDQVIAAQPGHVSALVERAQIAMDQGKPPEAEQLLREAAARSPEDPRVLSALIACLRLQSRTVEANRLQDRFNQLEALYRKR